MADGLGCHKYFWETETETLRFVKSIRPTPGEIHGMVLLREDNGGVLFVVQDAPDGLVRFRIYDLDLVRPFSNSIFIKFLLGSEEKRSPCGIPSAKRRRKRKENDQILSWSRKHSCSRWYVKIEPGNLADWHWRRCSTKDRRETERRRRRIHPSRGHLFWLRRFDALKDFLRYFFSRQLPCDLFQELKNSMFWQPRKLPLLPSVPRGCNSTAFRPEHQRRRRPGCRLSDWPVLSLPSKSRRSEQRVRHSRPETSPQE